MDCVDGECPFDYTEPQGSTSWSCEEVGGEPQCVMTGVYSGTDNCNNEQPSSWGICGRQTEGEWTKVPEQCTTQ
jgi:hypothetical protein